MRWDPETYRADWRSVVGIMRSAWFDTLLSYRPLAPRDRVLEVGVGSGKWSAAFALAGCTVYAVDNHPGMLERAQANFPSVKVAFLKDDALTLSQTRLLPARFDLVFSEGLVEHFLEAKERALVLINMVQVTKPGGAVAVYVPARSREPDEHYFDPHNLNYELGTAGLIETKVLPIPFTSASGEPKMHLAGFGRKPT